MSSPFVKPQPLPDAWVQRIFARLSVVYGRDFLSRWEGQDLSIVMSDWARELAGFDANPAAIAHALEHLPADKAPNALQFRAMCLAKPAQDAVPRLAGPRPTGDKVARLREIGERLKAALDTEGKGPAYTAKRLREIAKQRPLTEAQKRALAECERVEAPSEDMGTFRPIPPELWPWNQQREAA